MKKIIILALTFIVICSCQQKSNLEGIELNKYFFELSDFETPKILEYTLDSVGVKHKVFYQIEKLNENQLKITKFDWNYNETEFYKYLYKPTGVYLVEGSFIENPDTNIVIDAEIQQGFIFPFEDYKSTLKSENSFNLVLMDSLKLQTRSSWKLKENTVKEINGEIINTIIGKGSSERTTTNSKNDTEDKIKIEMEIWYSEGIGVSKLKMETPYGIFEENFLRIMSIDEFEALRKNN